MDGWWMVAGERRASLPLRRPVPAIDEPSQQCVRSLYLLYLLRVRVVGRPQSLGGYGIQAHKGHLSGQGGC